jgi:hypothetical protein
VEDVGSSGATTAALGRLLIEHGVLTEGALERALAYQGHAGGRLGEILIEQGSVSRPLLAKALAKQSGVVLDEERGFGSGLRALLERRHLERLGLDAGQVDSINGLDGVVGRGAFSVQQECRGGERRAQSDRRKATIKSRARP